MEVRCAPEALIVMRWSLNGQPAVSLTNVQSRVPGSEKTHQHVDVMHEVQRQESELHDKIRVIDIRPLPFPRPLVIEVPKVDHVSAMNTGKSS